MTQARVRMLGPVTIEGPDGPVESGGPMARVMLVHLALARGRAVSDDRLIDGVWGESPPESGSVALRVHMTRLRSSVAALGWGIERRHGGYQLVADDVVTDVDEVDSLEAEARDRGRPLERLALVESAIALWRGPSLADVRRFPGAEGLAVELDRRRDALAAERTELMLDLGRAGELIGPLERELRDEPLDERRWAALATALYHTGRPGAALRAVNRARTALAEVAGLVPGPGLVELERRILVHDPLLAPAHSVGTAAPRPVPAALTAHAGGRFVGREPAIGELVAALDAVQTAHRSAVVRVSGESGIGKTTLVAHFAGEAAARGAGVLFGAASEGTTQPLGPFGPVLAQVVAETGDPDARAVDVLDRAIAGRSADADVLDPLDATAGRARAVDAIRDLLTLAARTHPVVAVLDDLHWADDSTRAAVSHLARYALDAPVLIVVVERSGRTPVVAGRDVADLEVGPLTERDLARWWDCPVGDPRLTDLVRHTGGVPFLVEALGLDGLDAVGVGAATAIGRRLLAERLDRLAERTARTAMAAAVVGPVVGFDPLSVMLALDDLELIDDLDDLVTAGVLRLSPSTPDTYQFAHDLFRMAVLDSASPLRIAKLHALALDAIGASALGPLGAWEHARAGGRFVDDERRAALAMPAVTLLLNGYAFEDALAVADAVVDEPSFDTLPDHLRVHLMLAHARATAALDRPDEARRRLDEALAVAMASGDAELVSASVTTRTVFGYRFVEDTAGTALLAEAIGHLPPEPTLSRFSALRLLAYEHLAAGRVAEADAVMADAAAVVRAIDDPAAIAEMHALEHWRAEIAADPAMRRAAVAALRELVERTGDERAARRANALEIIEFLHDGDPEAAGERARWLADHGHKSGQPHAEWIGLAAQFTPPFLAADFAAAGAAAQAALDRGRRAGVVGVRGTYATQQFALGWASGALGHFVDPLRQLAVDGPDLVWRAALALALVEAGQREEARAVVRDSSPQIDEASRHWLGIVGVAVAAEAASELDDRDVLAQLRPALERRLGSHVLLGTGVVDYGPVERYLALTLLGSSDAARGVEMLHGVATDRASGRVWQDRAAAHLTRLGAPVEPRTVAP